MANDRDKPTIDVSTFQQPLHDVAEAIAQMEKRNGMK
jgi:hypothetical protein